MDSTLRNPQLGKYSLVAEIARGGMGIVFLAQAIGRHGFKKLVVVKQLKPELAEDEKFREMFLDEARLAARLNHRNIVQTTEVDEEDNRYYFVMEYLEGRTLHAALQLKGDRALPQTTLLWILCDVLAGLHYAHELTDFDGKPLGVVHRDVSPRNIFLTYDGQVKLLDFGVAKAAGRGHETEAGELKGRIPYMCPEHVREKDIDRRADIFSVGVLLREVLTGQRMWGSSNEVEILSRLLERDLPPLPEDVEIPEEAREILAKSLAPSREDRYRTAHEMRAALERFVARLDKTGATAKFGDALGRAFAEHRAQLKEIIEQHVAYAEASPPSGQPAHVPALPELATAQGAGAASSSRVRTATPKAQRTSSPSHPSLGSAPSSPKPSPRAQPAADAAPRESGVPDVSPSAPPELTVTKERSVAPPSMPPPAKRSSVGTYIVLGIGFVALVAGMVLAIRAIDDSGSSQTKPREPEPSPTPTLIDRRHPPPVPPPSTSAVPDTRIEVTVRAVPPIAHIWVDDVHIGEGPHTQKFEKGSQHVFRAMAAGYVPRTETITVTAVMSVNLVLEKEGGTTPPTPSRAPGH